MQSSKENNKYETKNKGAWMLIKIFNEEKWSNFKRFIIGKLEAECIIRREWDVETKILTIKSRKW